ncbi:SRPBCC domain-containing protein [Jiangella rhizosphaerae]|uniref:Transcriptional regulator n=1 Tax=Jiangella rhizosphaerae TaxID=2293569 RepID=A0A418KRY0_9ACTN|nr:SRPBCC domain-containing protein [Jiangella rhizosphaerae]RIQ24563.1 transcriptional regulator [Jiangella rhizosphaerae]
MTTATQPATTQVYRIYIKATPEKIWDAITQPEWTARYGYTGLASYDLRPGGAYSVAPTPEFKAAAEAQGFPCPDVIIDGEVIEAEPPRRLVTTFRMLMDPAMAEEGFTRITHEINPAPDGKSCSLTVTHELDGAPLLAAMVHGDDEASGAGGGHAWVLSDLKSLLETGSPLAG